MLCSCLPMSIVRTLGHNDMKNRARFGEFRLRRRRSACQNRLRNSRRSATPQRRSVLLEPMNPFERRIIHTTLNDIIDMNKERGRGLMKQVRVMLKGRKISALDKLILGPFKDAAGHGPGSVFFCFASAIRCILPANYRCALFDSIKIYLILCDKYLCTFALTITQKLMVIWGVLLYFSSILHRMRRSWSSPLNQALIFKETFHYVNQDFKGGRTSAERKDRSGESRSNADVGTTSSDTRQPAFWRPDPASRQGR